MSNIEANLEKGTEIARVENVQESDPSHLNEVSGKLPGEVFPGVTKETILAFLVRTATVERDIIH
jgi:hypothetical protein